MYTKLFAPTLLAAAFVALPCLANPYADGEVGYIPPTPIGSTTTRAEVVAEYIKSLEPQLPAPPSTVTRAEVVAELMAALSDGTMQPYGEGAYPGAVLAQRPEPVMAHPMLAAR